MQSPARSRTPVSTYRLQLHRDFGFRDALALIDYLDALGVSDCYSSPFLQASPGSTHGYDICDHTALNRELGSEEDFQAFARNLATRRMGLMLDFVPNHMGIDPQSNPWWRDVLQRGERSRFARFFDIDWTPLKRELRGKVLLPILGDQYGVVLERGELRVQWQQGEPVLRYFERCLPLDPLTWPDILEHRFERIARDTSLAADDIQALHDLSRRLRELAGAPAGGGNESDWRARCDEERARLARLVNGTAIGQQLEDALRDFNGTADDPRSFDTLHALLERQAYRLAYWRTASHEINYRRFFDINELAGLRMEDGEVFAETHALVLRLIRAGAITALRLDHIDGLYDPLQYLDRLQRAIAGESGSEAQGPSPSWFFVVVEKILSTGEVLPERWPVFGTSGYDFLNDLNRLFIDHSRERRCQQIYRRFTGSEQAFADVGYHSKKLIMGTTMASELNVLAHAFNTLSELDRRTRDFTLNSLRDALQEVIACFPLYRTYVDDHGIGESDRLAVDSAIAAAKRRNPTIEPSIFELLRTTLLPQPLQGAATPEPQVVFAKKFQQYTGPLQAKGVEDTAFYRHNLLLSLNEVGGDPERFGGNADDFHTSNQRRHRRWPATMLATATHDTKRGEDARARINLISELPQEWAYHLSQWSRANRSNRTTVDGRAVPSRNEEYLFYQSLLGAFPSKALPLPIAPDDPMIARLQAFMTKAVREAKQHSSWMTPNVAHEEAVQRFVARCLSGRTAERFFASFLPFQQRIAQLGAVNSLAQVVLKIASPGVADFYQGTELWDLSLVDPDNRRPVDYRLRRERLAQLEPLLRQPQPAEVGTLLESWRDATIKLFVTAAGLRLRRSNPHLFLAGSYEPLGVAGAHAERVVALCRRRASDSLLAIAPRLISALAPAQQGFPLGSTSWEDTATAIPSDSLVDCYRNVLTGETVSPKHSHGQLRLPLAEVFATLPVALLVPQS